MVKSNKNPSARAYPRAKAHGFTALAYIDGFLEQGNFQFPVQKAKSFLEQKFCVLKYGALHPRKISCKINELNKLRTIYQSIYQRQ